ncbi:MAG TPA: glycosyltransferase family 9 protein [Fimbriimonadaceae bacterium]|nr:glycosyltransferase family 9 protein [Fimbriimonadaceae bacterium]
MLLKDYIGDSVMASALVRSLAANSGELTLAASPTVRELLRFPNFQPNLVEVGRLSKPVQLWNVAQQLRRAKLQAIFLVNRSFRSALAARLSGTPIRVGHSTEGRSWLLTHAVRYDEAENEAQSYLHLAQALDIQTPFTTPELYVSEEERAAGLRQLQGATVGIQPGARHDYKEIPVAVLLSLVDWLKEHGKRIAYFGGPEERGKLQDLGDSAVDLVGKTTLRGTLAALSGLELMIGGDTGVMHLAASVGTPTVTAFGRTPTSKWGWFTAPHQVLQAPNGNMSDLSADELIATVERALCAG